MFYCLNLPPDMRYEEDNIYTAAITPPPKAPSHESLLHLLGPVIGDLKEYANSPGQRHETYSHPEGADVEVRGSPLVADSQARVEAAGCMAHAAINFCEFCTEVDKEEVLIYEDMMRDPKKTKGHAERWKAADTHDARKVVEKEHGMKWSAFWELHYWNSVDHVILGFMHNWLEGVLQHHMRVRWGIGRPDKKTLELKQADKDEETREADVAESAEEVDAMLVDGESEIEYVNRAHSGTPSTVTGADVPVVTTKRILRKRTVVKYEFVDQGSSSSSEDLYEDMQDGAYTMPKIHMGVINTCIKGASLPTCVNRPNATVGKKKAAKLKAEEILTCITLLFPLCIPELWSGKDATPADRARLQNFIHLVICTNIVCSYQTSESEADEFATVYQEYRNGLNNLFPMWAALPNHHWSGHDPWLMKNWGPLPPLGEFSGERTIGRLQDINLNQ